jgi:hypothetical protein
MLVLVGQLQSLTRLYSQDVLSDGPDLPAPLFLSEDPLFLTLSMDIRTVIRDIEEEKSHWAEIRYTDPEGNEIILPIKIKVRGNFRKDPGNCNFPPLRLNFSNTTVLNTIFAGQDKVKLVTHCQSGKDRYEQNVLKEYMAYKLYNLFSEESFRVRLVHMTYADTEGRVDTLEKMAFMIEPKQQMARRNGCEIFNVKNVHQNRTHTSKTLIMSVFQYMIGNTDWSVYALHNVVLLKNNSLPLPIVVPYDFDWCGMVNAPYATPADNLPIESVTTRLYRGFCKPDDELQPILDKFKQRREEVYQTCRNVPFLSEKELSKILKYMDQFYKILDNPKAVDIAFHRECRER